MALSRRSFLSVAALPLLPSVSTVEGPRQPLRSVEEYLGSDPYMRACWNSLTPVSKFVFKLLNHIELNDDRSAPKHRLICVRHPFHTTDTTPMCETDYLEYLYSQGRSNIRKQDVEPRELVGVFGSRGGKDDLTSFILGTTTHRLVNGVVPLEEEQTNLFAICSDKTAASHLFSAAHLLYRSSGIVKHLSYQTLSHFRFHPQATDPSVSVRPTFKSCMARGLRKAHTAILNDCAYYRDSRAEAIWPMMAESTRSFQSGKLVLLSSPNGKTGLLWDRFSEAMRCIDKFVLALQIPSWEMNPYLHLDFYKSHRFDDKFEQEYGAQFG